MSIHSITNPGPMKIHIQDTPKTSGEAAGALVASVIRTVLQMRNEVIILATGSSHLLRYSTWSVLLD